MPTFKSLIHSPRAVAAAILGAGGLAIYVLDFPGSMEDDSFAQLLEGRTGSYSFWHPPIMSWMLGVSDALPGPPEAWFVLFDTAVAFAALIGVLWLARRVSWAAAIAAGAMLFLPQLMMFQGIVWKDALFADACVAGFVALALAGEHWQRVRLRIAMLTACAVLLALAMLARQNGLVILPFAVVGLWIVAAKREGRRRAGAVYGAALLAVAGGLALGANALLELRWDGTPAREEQFKILRLYDLTGMVKHDPHLRLDVLSARAPRLAQLMRSDGVRLWSPVKNDTLELDQNIVDALESTPAPVLAAQWRDSVAANPWFYLRLRAQLFRWVFQSPDVGQCHPFHVGDEGNAEDMQELGATTRLDRRDIAFWHYGEFLEYTPVFWHGLYALAALIVFVLLLRRRRPADIAFASLIAAVGVFTATFFVISIACDYRYLYVIDLTALAGVLYVAAEWRELLCRDARAFA